MVPPLFYKYVTDDVALKVLSSCMLQWSHPSTFNDPSDCRRNPKLVYDAAALCNAAIERLWSLVCGNDSRYDAEDVLDRTVIAAGGLDWREAGFEHFDRAVRPSIREEIAKIEAGDKKSADAWAAVAESIRVLCLSEVKDSSSLWAYYGGQHAGAVIALEPLDFLDTGTLAAMQVQYSDQPPRLATDEELIKHVIGERRIDFTALGFVANCFATKESCYSHEREWRIVTRAQFPEVKRELHPIHALEVSDVYLGCRASATFQSTLLSLLSVPRFRHVSIHRVTNIAEEYRMNFTMLRPGERARNRSGGRSHASPSA